MNHFNPRTVLALPALHPPLPPRTHVPVQSKHLTTITTPTPSHSAAASPPNFKINHRNGRRLLSLSARALHPSQQHKFAAQWSNAFGPLVDRVLFNHSFIKRLRQRSSSRQQNHVPCMQGQRQQHITSRRRPRASHTTPRHRQHRNINVYSLQQQRWHVLMACGAVAALVREWSPRPYF